MEENLTGKMEAECAAYFKQYAVFEKILKGFKNKYISFGKFAGTLKLKDIPVKDVEVLEGFFGQNFHGQKSISISAVKFEKALNNSRFQGIDMLRLLEIYFGEKIRARKDVREEKENTKRKIFEEALNDYEETEMEAVLEDLTQIIWGKRTSDLAEWKRQLYLAADIYQALPVKKGEYLYLAVFAAALTGNPHAFDRGEADGDLLYKVVQYYAGKRGKLHPDQQIFPAFTRKNYYLNAGIMVDDVSNSVMVYGIQAVLQNGKLHPGVQGFYENREMMQIPLSVIMQWKKVICPGNVMYVVENPSVFAMLCRQEDIAVMCVNGQPRMAALKVLELLAESNAKVYYGGDFDPEGILIAQKIAMFYKGECEFWHMDPEDYMKCCSDTQISGKRLKSLEKITDHRLLPVAVCIRREKRAGYQERLLIAER